MKDFQAKPHGHITGTEPYSCHNRPRPTAATAHQAQDGWFYQPDGMTRKPRMVSIPNVMSTACRFDKQTSDLRCRGCTNIDPAILKAGGMQAAVTEAFAPVSAIIAATHEAPPPTSNEVMK